MSDLKAFCVSLLKDCGGEAGCREGKYRQCTVCCPNLWKAGEFTVSDAQLGKMQVHFLDWLFS